MKILMDSLMFLFASDNDDYEKIKALENISYKQSIRLSDNKILLQKYYWVCLFECKK